jgi:membrane fusion protein, multidrug efflux system
MTPYARSVVLSLFAATLVVSACSSPQKNGTAAAPAVGRPPVPVTVATVQAGDMTDVVNVVGSLEPKFASDVKSEISGTVTDVYVTEWVSVRKGARLARLDTSETEASIEGLKASVAQARVQEARARREYERSQQLKQYGLITPQALDDAKDAVAAAEAMTAGAVAQVRAGETRLAKSSIVAPMDGVVAFRGVSVGDRVENMGGTTSMFRIVDNRRLDLTVSVPSSNLAEVHVGQILTFSTDTVPGRTFTGKVMFINPSIDPASRSAKVIAEVINSDGVLKGGSFVKGQIVVATRAGVVQVPREALLNWDVQKEAAEILIVTGDQTKSQPVKTGRTSEAMVEIVSGIQAGNQVVVRGGYSVRPGDKVVIAKGEGA